MNEYDRMVLTPIPKLIIQLSIPAIISMLITNIYNLVDTAFVGQLGTSASGAVGIVFGFMGIIQAFGFMYGQGAGSILSRALGEKNKNKADIYTSAGFFFSFLTGLILTVIGFILLDDFITILGSTETIRPFARDYLTYILLATPFMASSLTLNNMLRYEGKATLGMIGLMVGAILNMAGDPILMFGLNLGISGAGISTMVSQIISWAILLLMYLLKKTTCTLKIVPLNFHCFFEISTTGLPSLIRQGLTCLTTIVLNAQCMIYGDAAIAAMSIVSRIFFFAFSITLGIGQGFQPVSSFNYGAEKYNRLRQGFNFTLWFSEFLMIVESVFLYYYASNLIGIFRNDPAVIEIGTRALRLQTIAQIFMPACMTIEMLFQSIGKRIQAIIISSMRNGILLLPLLIILPMYRGLSGIQEAQPLAIILTLPLSIPFAIYFFRHLPKTV